MIIPAIRSRRSRRRGFAFDDDPSGEDRRTKAVVKKLTPYDDEIEQIEAEIEKATELKRAVEEKLATLQSRISDLRVQRAHRSVDLKSGGAINVDRLPPSVARIRHL